MKLLLYCTKSKPYLYDQIGIRNILDKKYKTFNIKQFNGLNSLLLNGKIVAECDYEVEEITTRWGEFETKKYSELNLRENSCLTHRELCNYFGKLRNMYGESKHCGYAIHIKNLHIFDEPRELAHSTIDNDSYYYTAKDDKKFKVIRCNALIQAPQNMMYAFDYYGNSFALISIKPYYLCKILNGEKEIEVRKKILKGMLNNAKKN